MTPEHRVKQRYFPSNFNVSEIVKPDFVSDSASDMLSNFVRGSDRSDQINVLSGRNRGGKAAVQGHFIGKIWEYVRSIRIPWHKCKKWPADRSAFIHMQTNI
jgi:hypothetical protein